MFMPLLQSSIIWNGSNVARNGKVVASWLTAMVDYAGVRTKSHGGTGESRCVNNLPRVVK